MVEIPRLLRRVWKSAAKYSLIFHRFNFKIGENRSGAGAFKYSGKSLTNALYLSSEIEEYDLLINGFISIEMIENESGITEYTEQRKANIAKAGISLGLVFWIISLLKKSQK